MFRPTYSLPVAHALVRAASRLVSTLLFAALPSFAQPIEVVEVRAQALERTINIPGEILPYQRVTLHSRANGYVERVNVDRGDQVKQGDVLVTITAPEVAAQIAEAESRVHTTESAIAEGQARLAAVEATYERLKKASATEGAIAGNELIQAEKAVDAARAVVRSAETAVKSAQAALHVTKQMEQFLKVTAPFSGSITERLVHPGALVGPSNGSAGALLELEQISRLRVIVPLPEAEIGSVRTGTRVSFKVPAYPGRTFSGAVARVDRSLDAKTRTMAVELDVQNPRNELAPGMYPEIAWPAKRAGNTLVVPPTAVVTTTERTFVVRVNGDKAEWVNVRKGALAGDLVEVIGPLSPGDLIVKRANDEMREGSKLTIKK